MNMMKPFFVVLLVLAVTMATQTPAVRAGDDTDIEIEGGFWWYIHIGRFGNTCPNTFWGRRVCQNKGLPLTCCNRKCVDCNTHKYHCGSCGFVCPFPEQCCGGKCVNVFSNGDNCGKCNNKCPHKDCYRGLCRYAA